MSKPSFFITTPIYYVNAAPHLGTAYSTILADVQARYRRAMGYDVKFLTGMDEHGEKVAEAAEQHGFDSPQAWCDSQAPLFQDLWKTLEISNDDFIRTTEPRQHHAVQCLWERMQESGYLYKGSYDGWYCVPDETYYTDNQVKKGDEEYGSVGQHLCPDCHRPLERVQEESYFFKLSAFQDKLLALYDEHPEFVQPDFRLKLRITIKAIRIRLGVFCYHLTLERLAFMKNYLTRHENKLLYPTLLSMFCHLNSQIPIHLII